MATFIIFLDYDEIWTENRIQLTADFNTFHEVFACRTSKRANEGIECIISALHVTWDPYSTHNGTRFFLIDPNYPKNNFMQTDFSLDSQFIFPPPQSGLLRNTIFYVSRIIKILSGYAKKVLWHVLIRSCQDLIKVLQEMFVYQDLGKMIQVMHELTKSCMSWQVVSSFVSLGSKWQNIGNKDSQKSFLQRKMSKCSKWPNL